MWYKVSSLFSQSFKICEITALTGLERHTVSAYLKMTEADWLARAGRAGSSRASRLDPYEHEFVNMLTSYPFTFI